MSTTIHIRGEEGALFHLAPEAVTQFIADRLAKGYLKRVNADGTPYVEDTVRVCPKVTDSKAEWVGWAVHISQSTDTPITPDDAEALTKQDLIELFKR
jgi:hypothetical protein